MRTILDEFRTWFLHALCYQGGELHVVVVEGFCSTEPEDVEILGLTIRNSFALAASAQSRYVEVRFADTVAWQVLDESYSAFDAYEQAESKCALAVLSRSKYLDYVNACHGWYAEVKGPAKHYRVWTENEVVDVVACREPTVQLIDRDGKLTDRDCGRQPRPNTEDRSHEGASGNPRAPGG
jgi:hypothetical protein